MFRVNKAAAAWLLFTIATNIPTSFFPLFTIVSHASLTISLIALIARSIHRASVVLPPSANVRRTADTRGKHIKLFTGLALFSLVLAGYGAFSYTSQSYTLFATNWSSVAPRRLFGYDGAIFRIEFLRWIIEEKLYTNLLRLPVATSRNYWWAQALDLTAVPWALYLSVVGHRRHIDHLWAYAALSQLVSLSFAQNLFYLSLILTPAPLPSNAREMAGEPRILTRLAKLRQNASSKPENWVPRPIVVLGTIVASFAAIALTPTAYDTTTFIPVTILARVLPFAPLALPYLVPESWGTTHTSAARMNKHYTNLFRIISALSFILYVKSTSMAIIFNDPGETYLDPKYINPLHREERGDLDRTTTTMGRIMAAAFGNKYTMSSPIITKIGWDVVISGVSLGCWAAVRGTDANAMINNVVGGLGGEAGEGDSSLISGGMVDDLKRMADTASTQLDKEIKAVKDDQESRRATSSRHTGEETEKSKRKSRARREEYRNEETEDEDEVYVPNHKGLEQIRERVDEEMVEEDVEAAALAWGIVAALGLGTGASAVFGAEAVRG